MLTSRLLKRLSALNFRSLQEYYDFLLSPSGRSEEIIKMIDLVTTNKTDFFRDERQFNFLSSEVLPVLANGKKLSAGNRLNIWSAGCSTGEEPYTIAIVLSEFCGRNNLENSFLITGTDISTKVLEAARAGVYRDETVLTLPRHILLKYFTKKKISGREEYHVSLELKKYIKILRFNLMENDFKPMNNMDIIYCRNVIIYFDKQTQKALFEKFHACLKNGGYLFIGSSESLFNITDKFRMIAPSVYVKV